ncbi:Hypothetical predicted protein [Olea europaea subsp. europaea]|uniref:Uncharacterized protein n=1 Tax=Olea europaea subsp. europaea TaxID=158383 RepID=A0A8S0R6Q7_OLEEU|nr:Hypothetical predicted protein [Olea europaea subsp. europaea]
MDEYVVVNSTVLYNIYHKYPIQNSIFAVGAWSTASLPKTDVHPFSIDDFFRFYDYIFPD